MNRNSAALKIEAKANMFAALGDPTRLTLVTKLNDGQPHSISNLTVGTQITRQAVTRHLSVLENVGLVTKIKDGREILFLLDPEPLKTMQEYLDIIAGQWNRTLNSLKEFVENS